MITLEDLFEMYLETNKCINNPLAEDLKNTIEEKIYNILHEKKSNEKNKM